MAPILLLIRGIKELNTKGSLNSWRIEKRLQPDAETIKWENRSAAKPAKQLRPAKLESPTNFFSRAEMPELTHLKKLVA
jgi:hypothetical protein